MRKTAGTGLLLIVLMTAFAGCATARRPEVRPEPVVAAPAPAPDNSAEMEKLKQQVADQQAALAQSEADKRALAEKLDETLASRKPAETKKSEDSSYLK